MMFTDVEKAYDTVSKDVLWRYLVKKGVAKAFIRVVNDMNKEQR